MQNADHYLYKIVRWARNLPIFSHIEVIYANACKKDCKLTFLL